VIPKECKRLAEVDFPIAVVSKHAAREKSIRHGHPSTLHLWWARRPLAACRAVLLGLLLPDPCDEHCPQEFKKGARELLPRVQGKVGPKDEDLRKALLKFIGDFANWDLSANPTYLEVSRGLVKAAHPEETPLVVDSFAGGGSIPLEALRLGCEAFASDLNPVACLILKVMLEDIPRHGRALAEELRRVGAQIKAEAEKELAEFYPPDPGGAKPIAYLWARTVRCEAPNCGTEIPLVRSCWLARKQGRKYALRYKVLRPSGQQPYLTFEVFQPKNESDVQRGTVSNAKALCPACNTVLPPDRLRAQLSISKGGAECLFDNRGNRIGGAILLAVITIAKGKLGRIYRVPNEKDFLALAKVKKQIEDKVAVLSQAGIISPIPDEPINETRPSPNARGLSAVTRYGMKRFGDLFAPRQKLSLLTFVDSINAIELSKTSHPEVLKELLAMAFGKMIMQQNSQCRWNPNGESAPGVFGRQALPMIWDFIEAVPSGESIGSFQSAIGWISDTIAEIGGWQKKIGTVEQSDATKHPLPNSSASIWFTDPPYYDAVPYSDLSDFFYVWLKRILRNHKTTKGDTYDSNNPLTPKIPECVWNQAHFVNGEPKTPKFFEDTVTKAFAEGRRVLGEEGIAAIVFAHKSTEGWEALLSGILNSNLVILASWPITTEMGGRLNAQDAAALSASIHLVCRPRPEDASVGDWGEVLRELPRRVGNWMERLQSEGIRGADLVFACIGPALEIFSRYSKVETAEGRKVTLAEYLEKVWEVVGRTALENVLGTTEAKARNGVAGALEEDARLTALFLWTLQSTATEAVNGTEGDGEDGTDDEDEEDASTSAKKKGFSLIFDVVRRFAQPLGIRLENLEGRIIETHKGIVRLMSVEERAPQLVEPGVVHDVTLADLDPSKRKQSQLDMFKEAQQKDQLGNEARRRLEKATWSQLHLDTITTLDHVHKAMLFQKQGRTTALRELLFYEQHYRPEFLRLANALSALYPKNSDEKRLLDAMLLAVSR